MALASITGPIDITNMALQRLGEPIITTMTEHSRNAILANQLYTQNRDYCLMLTDWDCLMQRAVLTRAGKIAIAGISKASPAIVTATGHVFINNELVYVESAGGMTEINGASYRVFSYTSTTITLYDLDGTTLDSSGYTAWTSGGFVYRDPSSDWAFAYDLPTDCLRVIEVLDITSGQSNDYEWKKERTFIYTDLENAGIKYLKQVTDPSLYEADLVEAIVARLAWYFSMRITDDKALRQALYQEMNSVIARAKLSNAMGREDEGKPEALWVNAR